MQKQSYSSIVPLEFKDRNVCILGLGFVGITLATVMAEVGFHVTGIEIREEVVNKIRNGLAHFFEPGLSDKIKLMIENKRLEVFTQIPNSSKSTVYIITVGTPLDEGKKVNLSSIQNITKEDVNRVATVIHQFLNVTGVICRNKATVQ